MWPIFVISLNDQSLRRRKISDQFSKLGLEFEFIDAIDGRQGLPASFQRTVDRARTMKRLGREMSDAEYAAVLSHMSVYERIMLENLDGAIVLEDDAILLDGFLRFVQAHGYQKADLIQFDYFKAIVWKSSGIPILDDVLGFRLFRNAPLSTGYSISRTGANYIRSAGLPVCATADWPCDVTKLGALVTKPRLVRSSDPDFATSSLHQSRLGAQSRRQKRRDNVLFWIFRRARAVCARVILTKFD